MTWRDPAAGGLEARERQRRTFEWTAKRYDRYRPTYPDALFEDLRAYSALEDGDRVLEIGCGSGQATLPIARWGNPLLALEPAPAMAEIARRKLGDTSSATVVITRFEDWEVDRAAFGLVLCAQAFHWLDPDTRYERIESALRPGGTLALMRNTQVVPDQARPFFVSVQDVYARHAPGLAHEGTFRAQPSDEGRREVEATGLFRDVDVRRYPWHWTLARDDYLGLLSTHSPHAALDDEARFRLLEGIGELIDSEFGGRVTEHYIAELYLARKPWSETSPSRGSRGQEVQ